MITLITGLPGSGKTLWTLCEVKKLAERDGRPVFVSGIPELTLPWVPLDEPKEWFKLPTKAIVCVDECQRIWRPRHASAAVPEHVAQFETHRHLAIDLFLLTQHPSLVDPAIRKLAGRHIHLVRKFGMQFATVYEFPEVRDNVDKYRSGAMESQFPFPKGVYAWYKSADAHTHKRRIPFRIWFALAVPFLLIGGLWYGLSTWYEKSFLGATKGKAPATAPAVVRSPDTRRDASSGLVGNAQPGQLEKVSSLNDYVSSRIPAVPGLPHTAPRYATIITPKRAPAPSMCIREGERCLCYTEDATRLPAVPDEVCKQIVEHGYFVDWQDKPPMPSASEPMRAAERAAPAKPAP